MNVIIADGVPYLTEGIDHHSLFEIIVQNVDSGFSIVIVGGVCHVADRMAHAAIEIPQFQRTIGRCFPKYAQHISVFCIDWRLNFTERYWGYVTICSCHMKFVRNIHSETLSNVCA